MKIKKKEKEKEKEKKKKKKKKMVVHAIPNIAICQKLLLKEDYSKRGG